jgi:hypothetical protein
MIDFTLSGENLCWIFLIPFNTSDTNAGIAHMELF